MQDITLPSVVKFEAGKTATTGKLIVEPLYPGYGTTIGNALRRVLLSSLPGAAVTAVKIAHASHEFSALPKVQEDILQIIMNLKQLRLRVYSEEPVKLHLTAKGEKVVTAKDIEKNSDVEIADENLTIATLTAKDATLEMDIWVTRGRGYQMTEAGDSGVRETGIIAVDSFFSPVRRVSFTVESARVGQMTNFDRLVMNIETDATISAEDAVKDATLILVQQFGAIGHVNEHADAGVVAAEPQATVAKDEAEVATEEVASEEPKRKSSKKKSAA
ncbi:MAG: DNA-directed RNA polymerase subunit alpha [Patescibacteria group bacterium]|jgi:DNA-directed RNA polymerase subunit alpha